MITKKQLLARAQTLLAKNEEEENYLNETMLPEKLIAGFTTVSIGSVVLAGIFSQLL